MKERGPEFNYVVILEEKDKGNPKIQCCFCNKEFVGAVLIRIYELKFVDGWLFVKIREFLKFEFSNYAALHHISFMANNRIGKLRFFAKVFFRLCTK